MQFAVTKAGGRTNICEALENEEYYCPYCGNPMIQRHGQINIPHFAHMKGYLCTDTWKYEEMSEWHQSWQSRYPEDAQEVVVAEGEIRHRADVFINNTVVEFQHSPISVEEFGDRNAFYISLGYSVIWLFDAVEDYRSNLSVDESEADVYRWKHAPKMLTGFDLYGSVQVYFHIEDKTSGGEGSVIRLTWCSNGDLSYFKSASSECYTEEEFVELTTTGKVVDKDTSKEKDYLYHKLFAIRRKNGDVEVVGCPLNPNGYAPTIHEPNRIACDECEFCKNISEDHLVYQCSGRFNHCLDTIRSVIEVARTSDDVIYSIQYIDVDGIIHEETIEMPECPATSILDLSCEYDAGVMVVRNIKNGHKFKISKDVQTMVRTYGRVYGYMWYDQYNNWAKQGKEIFGFMKPEWVMEWYVTPVQKEQFLSRYKTR